MQETANIQGTWERNLTILLPSIPLRPLQPSPRKGVYVAGFGPYIKIGISADVHARVASLQTPEVVEIYAVLDGWIRQERELHRRFEKYRLNGEWFKRDGELAKWIDGGCRYPPKRRVRLPRRSRAPFVFAQPLPEPPK